MAGVAAAAIGSKALKKRIIDIYPARGAIGAEDAKRIGGVERVRQ
jgi:hypothetical protein